MAKARGKKSKVTKSSRSRVTKSNVKSAKSKLKKPARKSAKLKKPTKGKAKKRYMREEGGGLAQKKKPTEMMSKSPQTEPPLLHRTAEFIKKEEAYTGRFYGDLASKSPALTKTIETLDKAERAIGKPIGKAAGKAADYTAEKIGEYVIGGGGLGYAASKEYKKAVSTLGPVVGSSKATELASYAHENNISVESGALLKPPKKGIKPLDVAFALANSGVNFAGLDVNEKGEATINTSRLEGGIKVTGMLEKPLDTTSAIAMTSDQEKDNAKAVQDAQSWAKDKLGFKEAPGEGFGFGTGSASAEGTTLTYKEKNALSTATRDVAASSVGLGSETISTVTIGNVSAFSASGAEDACRKVEAELKKQDPTISEVKVTLEGKDANVTITRKKA